MINSDFSTELVEDISLNNLLIGELFGAIEAKLTIEQLMANPLDVPPIFDLSLLIVQGNQMRKPNLQELPYQD